MPAPMGGGPAFGRPQGSPLRKVRDDLEMVPFDAQGGLGRMYQLFGGQMDTMIAELNEALVH